MTTETYRGKFQKQDWTKQLNKVWKHWLNHCQDGYKCPWRWVETANSWLCSSVVEVIKRRPLAAEQCFELLQILAGIVKTVAFNSKYSFKGKDSVYVILTYIFGSKLLRNVARSQLNLCAYEIWGLSDVIKLIAARDLPELFPLSRYLANSLQLSCFSLSVSLCEWYMNDQRHSWSC